MDSIKQEVVNVVKNAILDEEIKPNFLPAHPDAEVEVQDDKGSLALYLRVTHPSIYGHRLFKVAVSEVM